MAVVEYTNLTTYEGPVYIESSSYPAQPSLRLFISSSGYQYIRVRDMDDNSYLQDGTSNTVTAGAAAIVTGRAFSVSGNKRIMATINSASYASGASVGQAQIRAHDRIAIGGPSLYNSSAMFLDGYVMEVLIYRAEVDQSMIDSAYGYLQGKWGL
jgi:hypothetical protein